MSESQPSPRSPEQTRESPASRVEAPRSGPRPPWWRNPWVLGIGIAMVAIPLMRPLLRFEPPPPPVLGQVPEFRLIDEQGEPFGSADLGGQVYVANFFFTRCTSICPLLIAAMSELDRRYREAGVQGIHLVSISVDPGYDRPPVLKEYAARNGVDPSRWTFLTGPAEDVTTLVTDGFKTAVGEPQLVGENIIDIAHSGKFVLVDGQGGIRGYYSSDDLGIDEVFHRSRHVLKEGRRSR